MQYYYHPKKFLMFFTYEIAKCLVTLFCMGCTWHFVKHFFRNVFLFSCFFFLRWALNAVTNSYKFQMGFSVRWFEIQFRFWVFWVYRLLNNNSHICTHQTSSMNIRMESVSHSQRCRWSHVLQNELIVSEHLPRLKVYTHRVYELTNERTKCTFSPLLTQTLTLILCTDVRVSKHTTIPC